MPSIQDLRRRIRSVSSTQQITRAMEMVSAAKLRRAQIRLTQARPYAEKAEEILKNLSGAAAGVSHPLLEVRPVRKTTLAVFTSDRGLCGSFNSNIIRRAETFLKDYNFDNCELVLVGKKGFDYYKRRKWTIRKTFADFGGNLQLAKARVLANDLMCAYENKETDQVFLLYTHFVSTTTYRVTLSLFLPLVPEKKEGITGDYIFEPSPAEIFEQLIPRFCLTRIVLALAESFASENGSRMISMGAATKNAGEMIENLTLVRNKVRQAGITKEILEIVSGAEALQ